MVQMADDTNPSVSQGPHKMRRMRLIGVILVVVAMVVGISVWRDKTTATKVSRDRISLRAIDTAIASYTIHWSAAPKDLEGLTERVVFDPPQPFKSGLIRRIGPFMPQIPTSQFAPEAIPRFIIITPRGGGSRFLVWTPGPDRRFDIGLSNQTREKLLSVESGGSLHLPFIPEIYDPTNGMRSSGDIVRGVDQWFDRSRVE